MIPTEDQIVTFKSLPIFYEKEKSGIKNNTVRKKEVGDSRHEPLNQFRMKFKKEMYIQIIRGDKPDKAFIRKVQDVTEWNGYWIITWDPSEIK